MIRIQYEISTKDRVVVVFVEKPESFTLEEAEIYIKRNQSWLPNPKIVEVTTKVLKEY